MSTVKRLALAIVQFLAEQKQYGNLSPDAQVGKPLQSSSRFFICLNVN